MLNFDPATAGESSSAEASKNDIVTYLKIHNSAPLPQGRNLAYKIKTTAPKSYQVKPFQGIVEPSNTNSIEITYVPL